MKTGYKKISGRINNRPLTERKLIDAVGTIIRRHGYKGLSPTAIAAEADVSKTLIYKYFKTMDKLIERYVMEKDFWMASKSQMTGLLDQTSKKSGLIEILVFILHKQFDFFFKEEEMQQLILWEITERSDLLNSIGNARESLGDDFFDLTERHFKGSEVNFRGVAAILVSGIYYLVLHSKKNESKQCGIDINTEEGRNEILKAIRQIVKWSFTAGKIKQQETPL
jgi:AcrR family transcriptional regulator